MTANFDRIARVYRWLEYASFGHALERCRFCFLPQLGSAQTALVLGDGDGRFLHQLLKQNGSLQADAVDASAEMLHLLAERCHTERVTVHHADVRTFNPPRAAYDCIATHFFLDCLNNDECRALAGRMRLHLALGGCWVVSEFRVPRGWLRLPAALLIRSMYTCFRVMTGLEPQRLPAHETALRAAGLHVAEEKFFLHGLLVAQIWRAADGLLN